MTTKKRKTQTKRASQGIAGAIKAKPKKGTPMRKTRSQKEHSYIRRSRARAAESTRSAAKSQPQPKPALPPFRIEPSLSPPPPQPPKLTAPIAAPSLLQPKGGQPVNTLMPRLYWMYVGGATRYEVEWSPDAHFGKGHSVTMISHSTALSLDAAHALKPATTYIWRVRGGNDAGWGPWSAPESFRSPDEA